MTAPVCSKTNGRMNPEVEVASLRNLSRPDLAAGWQVQFGAPPPKGLSRRILILGIAYRIQAAAYGDLDTKIDRALRTRAVGAPEPSAIRDTAPTLKPGMRLMREWYGRTHVVDVIEGGFVWKGKTYASLSPIARAITGAHWSGPRFFGLRSQGA